MTSIAILRSHLITVMAIYSRAYLFRPQRETPFRSLGNRVYDTYDAIVDACCDAWNALMEIPERIRSITDRRAPAFGVSA